MSADPLVRPFSSSLGAAVEDFILARQVEGRAPKTLRFYRQSLKGFCTFAGVLPPSGITVAVLRRYLAHLADSGVATRTQHNRVVAVKTFLHWLADEGDYDFDGRWLSRVKAPRVVAEQTQPFTEKEKEALFAAVGGGWEGVRLRAIMAVLLDTGVRASEICGLRLRDVDLETGAVHIRAVTSKTRRERDTALGLKAKKAAVRWWQAKRRLMDQRPDAAFFMGWNEHAMTDRTLHRLLTRHGVRAGVPDAHPHRFRHTFTRDCILAGMDLFTVQRLLGHSDLTMTRKYFAQVEADVTAMKRAKSPLDQVRFRI